MNEKIKKIIFASLLLGAAVRIPAEFLFVDDEHAKPDQKKIFLDAIEKIRSADPGEPVLRFEKRPGDAGYIGDVNVLVTDGSHGELGVYDPDTNTLEIRAGPRGHLAGYQPDLNMAVVHELHHARLMQEDRRLLVAAKALFQSDPLFAVLAEMADEAAAHTRHEMFRRKTQAPDRSVQRKYADNPALPMPLMGDYLSPDEYFQELEAWFLSGDSNVDYNMIYSTFFNEFFTNFTYLWRVFENYKWRAENGKLGAFTFDAAFAGHRAQGERYLGYMLARIAPPGVRPDNPSAIMGNLANYLNGIRFKDGDVIWHEFVNDGRPMQIITGLSLDILLRARDDAEKGYESGKRNDREASAPSLRFGGLYDEFTAGDLAVLNGIASPLAPMRAFDRGGR